jgi:hypothetical protein
MNPAATAQCNCGSIGFGVGDIVVGDGPRWELLVGVATNNALCGKKGQEQDFDACLIKDGDEGIPLKVGTLQQHVICNVNSKIIPIGSNSLSSLSPMHGRLLESSLD